MCAIQMVNRQDESTFARGMVVGAKYTSLSVKNCNTAGYVMLNSCPSVSRMVHHPKDIQPSDKTVGRIGVNMGQHPCGTL